jgi:hypothetical protein
VFTIDPGDVTVPPSGFVTVRSPVPLEPDSACTGTVIWVVPVTEMAPVTTKCPPPIDTVAPGWNPVPVIVRVPLFPCLSLNGAPALGVVTEGAEMALTVMVSDLFPVTPFPSVTVTVKVCEFAVMSTLPEITPVLAARLRLAGSAPLEILQVSGVVPPLATRVAE